MLIDWPNLARSLVLAAIFSGLFIHFYPRQKALVLEPLHMTKDDCRVMLRERPDGSSPLRFSDPSG